MSYSWFREGSCTVGASDVVRFQSANITTAPNKPVVGDAFTVGGFRFYEIIFIGSDATGEYIRLNRAYEEAAGSSISYAIARFASGTQNAKLVAMASAAINQKQISLDDMYEWYTSQADTVQFLGPDGTFTTLTTYFKLSQEITAVGGNAGAITVVANNITNVNTVATNIASVNLVAPSIPAINTVNTNMPAIVTVNADMVSVKNVSDNMADVKDAKPQADRAESEADRAEVEANKAMMAAISMYAMNEVQFESERAQNRLRFAASGYESFGCHNQTSFVNNGLWSYFDSFSKNVLFLGESGGITIGTSKSPYAVVYVSGVMFDIKNIASNLKTQSNIKFPQAPDGNTTYNKATGVNIIHASASDAFAAQAADPTNVEVVINRVDGWLKEVWAEEVSVTNPYIYPNGLLQSVATAMDGMSTSDSNRPASYYAFFTGDTTSKGKGLNFFALTDAQKKKVLSNRKNNLVLLNDGRLIQWRLRIRTVAGAGNGDWRSMDSPIADALVFSEFSRVTAQGALNDSLAYTPNADKDYVSYATGVMLYKDIGSYGVRGSNQTVAVNGECYALFGGTVKRLNQGAYHPSFNPSGTKFLQNISSPDGGGYWYLADQYKPTSNLECFTKAYALSGDISSTYSGHPDGRYYDAIYADGDGGVCRDMRYSAYSKSNEDFSYTDEKIRNKTYRGFEKQVFTRITTQISPTIPVSNTVDILKSSIPYTPVIGEYLYAFDGNVSQYVRLKITSMASDGSGNVLWIGLERPISRVINTYVILEQILPMSVGSSFMRTDVIAAPATLLASPIFTNGWLGGWIPKLPAGIDATFPLTRKSMIQGPIKGSYLGNSSAAWQELLLTLDFAKNTVAIWPEATSISVLHYTAYSKVTRLANNEKIYGASKGIGQLFVTQIHVQSHLAETFLNKIFTSYGPVAPYEQTENVNVYLAGRGYASTDTDYWYEIAPFGDEYAPKHSPLILGAPTSQTDIALKLLNYNVVINNQAFLQYASTELKHNGTNWGDDGRVAVVNNESSKTDLNGQTVKISTQICVEPIGWVKNKE